MKNIIKNIISFGFIGISTMIQLSAQNFNQNLSKLAYRYTYDHRGRQIEKKLPGVDTTYLVYDNRDRLVLTQDGNQRKQRIWLFTKYDVLNRPVLTGILSHSGNRESLQFQVDHFYANGGSYFEAMGGNIHGYTNQSFPFVSNAENILSITYYDNYDFLTLWTDADQFKFTPPVNEQLSAMLTVVGKATGSSSKIFNSHKYLRAVTHYDDRYRSIQTSSENSLDGIDRSTIIYGFSGNVEKTYSAHNENYKEGAFINVQLQNEYDHQLRLTGTRQTLQTPVWKNPRNVKAINPGVLTRDPTAPTGFTSWAESEQLSYDILNTWAELHFPDSLQTSAGGLSYASVNVNGSLTSINFGFKVSGDGFDVIEHGSTVLHFDDRSPDDALLIKRVGSQIKWYRNTDELYSSQADEGQLKLVIVMAGTDSYNKADVLGKIGFGITKTLAKYTFNGLDKLTEKNLGQLPNGRPLQSIDFRYNIKGQITSINHPSLANDGSESIADYFGMSLFYNDGRDGSANPSQFNGNISSITIGTKQLNSKGNRSWDFTYDKLNRLRSAYLTSPPTN